jgi:hypothetical protein
LAILHFDGQFFAQLDAMSVQRLAKHDVYDAASRSVDIALPDTFKKSPSSSKVTDNIQRVLFGTTDMRAFVLENFLTDEECNDFVDNSEKAGFLAPGLYL